MDASSMVVWSHPGSPHFLPWRRWDHQRDDSDGREGALTCISPRNLSRIRSSSWSSTGFTCSLKMASAVCTAQNGQLCTPARVSRPVTHLLRPREVTRPCLVKVHSRTPQVASSHYGLRLALLIQRGIHVSLHDLERVVSRLTVPVHEVTPMVSSDRLGVSKSGRRGGGNGR